MINIMNQKNEKIIMIMVFLCLISIPAASEEKPILTVLDLGASGVSEGEMRGIISLLTSGLFKTDKYTVIDVSERDAVMNEIEFSLSGCSDEQCQIELGKMLSAEFIVIGTIDPVGSRLIVSMKMIETSTSRTVNTADGIYGDLDELIDDLYNLAGRLAGVETAEPESEPELDAEELVKEAVPESVREPEKAPRKPFPVMKVINFSGIGVGAVAACLGGYLIYDAFNFLNTEVEDSFNAYDELPLDTEQSIIDSAYDLYLTDFDEFKTNLIVAGCVAGGGLIISGVFTWLTIKTGGDSNTAMLNDGRVLAYYNPEQQAVTLGFKFLMN